MFLTPSPIVTLVMLAHSANAESPMLSPLVMTTVLRFSFSIAEIASVGIVAVSIGQL